MVIQLLLILQMQLFEVQMSKPQRPTALYNAWHVTVTSWAPAFISHLRQCLLKRNNYRNYLLKKLQIQHSTSNNYSYNRAGVSFNIFSNSTPDNSRCWWVWNLCLIIHKMHDATFTYKTSFYQHSQRQTGHSMIFTKALHLLPRHLSRVRILFTLTCSWEI